MLSVEGIRFREPEGLARMETSQNALDQMVEKNRTIQEGRIKLYRNHERSDFNHSQKYTSSFLIAPKQTGQPIYLIIYLFPYFTSIFGFKSYIYIDCTNPFFIISNILSLWTIFLRFCRRSPVTRQVRQKTHKYLSLWSFFTQLLFLHSIRLASRPFFPCLPFISCRITFNSLHLFFGHLEATSSYHNAIQHYLHRHRSPRFRLSGDVGHNPWLCRGRLHWHSGRDFWSAVWRMLQFGSRLDKVNQLLWCPQ